VVFFFFFVLWPDPHGVLFIRVSLSSLVLLFVFQKSACGLFAFTFQLSHRLEFIICLDFPSLNCHLLFWIHNDRIKDKLCPPLPPFFYPPLLSLHFPRTFERFPEILTTL